ncbi:hypothetical protein CVT26_009509 [Gymnopilus dilepis]|uniref:F-box domain-containing protein n=1 Tax=Gymnopilus dilepis TaxID=231916 RepID=A0A409VJT7_9AGAR|nr:hypothetical protein CVT26_009509 [Gymnopilus dilepis]
MATQPNPALTRDILWYIFTMNADMFMDSKALTTTRHSSQVCREWRSVLLESPSLWGRLLDFDSASSRWSSTWMREILERSGEHSLLWIKANRVLDGEKVFIDILARHWSRIQRIVVNVAYHVRFSSIWKPIFTPAPLLEAFKITFKPTDSLDDDDHPWQSASQVTLFAEDAPALREFSALGYAFNLDAPWLSGLRSVCFGPPFRMEQVMPVIRSMPRLETLRLEGLYPKKSQRNLPSSISLAKLETLILEQVYFEDCSNILERLEVPSTCAIIVRPCSLISSHPLKTLIRPFVQVARRSLLDLSPRGLSLTYDHYRVGLADASSLGRSLFSFTFELSNVELTRTLLTQFAVPELVNVRTMHLNLECHGGSDEENMLRQFYSHCQSVQTVHIDDINLKYLYPRKDGRTNRTRLVFPSLTSLHINSLTFLQRGGTQYYYLQNFLRSRKRVGRPIKVLDLTECTRRRFDVGFLSEMTGLKVLWTDAEGRVFEHQW